MARLLGACAIFLLAGCAHSNTMKVEMRASTSGRGRVFDFDPSQGELVAWGTNGRLLQLWVHPAGLGVGTSTTRVVAEGCRGGFLNRVAPDGSAVLVEIHLCPRRDAPEGWQGWHADFELHTNSDVGATLPPKADFAVGWDRDLRQLRLASPVLRASVAVPDATAAPVRSYPEMFALAVIMGVVPIAPDGKYEVE